MSVRREPAPLHLRLYIAGRAPNSVRAHLNVRAICEEHFAGRYKLEVVDMMAFPHRALADGIVVTPTLVRISPLPLQRVIGNLSDTARVLAALGGT